VRGSRQVASKVTTPQRPSVNTMNGPPHDCKRKAEGEEKQSASMYPAFGWRLTLLAMMSFARACSYKPNGRKRPLCLADFRHAVVSVRSPLLLLCRLDG